MSTEAIAPAHRQVIEAGKVTGQYWRDLWRFRELLVFMVWRDVSVRYRQTFIGVAWAIIQPLSSMIILTLIFGKLAGMKAPEGVPHPIMVYTGTLPWFFFASILAASSQSMVSNTRLITKVYFPRLILPLTALGVTTIDFMISFSVFGVLCAITGFVPSWQIIFIPFYLLIASLTAYSVGLWLAAMNVHYRDIRYVVPFIIQFGLYASPVGYLSSDVEKYRFWYHLNPMATVIDGFRWCVLGSQTDVYIPGALLSAAIVGSLLAGGIWFFRRTERTFADII